MENDKIEKAFKETSLGWKVDVFYLLLQAVSIIMTDIDEELKKAGSAFQREKKMQVNRLLKCHKDAERYFDAIGVDSSMFDAVGQNSKRYDNAMADAFELVREILLYVDRSATDEGFYSIFRFMRSLPTSGRFTEKDIARFDFKRPWITGPGDRVRTERYGDGTVEFKGNGNNWVVRMDDGTQRVLEEKSLTLI